MRLLSALALALFLAAAGAWAQETTDAGTEAAAPAVAEAPAAEAEAPEPPPPTVLGVFHAKRLTNIGAFIAVFAALIALFLSRAKAGQQMYIRRIPGVDAIEEAIGRATEMGRPVLFVPGIEDMQDIQTIAGMLILGKVSETVARYNAEIIVANRVPFVMTVAEEVVREGFYRAGRPDAHKPDNIRFLSDEQFAMTAATNGIMLREKPATNLFMGRFYAESLMLAETGFQAKAIQVAGTAEITQLPFFVAACDYTLLAEELFAASAYLSGEPKILSTLKAADWAKVLVTAIIVAGVVAESVGWHGLHQWLVVR